MTLGIPTVDIDIVAMIALGMWLLGNAAGFCFGWEARKRKEKKP